MVKQIPDPVNGETLFCMTNNLPKGGCDRRFVQKCI